MSQTVPDQRSPKEKLAALKAERLKLEASMAPSEEEALELEIQKEERALVEAKAKAEAKRQLGNKHAEVSTPLGLVILKRSGTAAFRQLQEQESMATMDQLEAFIKPCVFYPSEDKFDRISEELPAALPLFFQAISVLMGAKQAETSKK